MTEGSPTVICADDERDILTLYKSLPTFFKPGQIEFVMANNRAEVHTAIQDLRQKGFKPSLLLTDSNDVWSGEGAAQYDFVDAILATLESERLSGLPVIISTGLPMEERRMPEGWVLVSKPFHIRNLARTIRSVMGLPGSDSVKAAP